MSSLDDQQDQSLFTARPTGPGDRLLEPVRLLFRWLGLALLTVMILMPAIQVVLREFLRAPFIGAEELARFMLICVVFITLPYVVTSGANIRMEELLVAFPARARTMLRAAITATGALAFGIAAVSVAVATLANLQNATPTLGIPYWVFFSAAFAGLLFASIECIVQLVKIARNEDPYVTFAAERAPAEPTLGGH